MTRNPRVPFAVSLAAACALLCACVAAAPPRSAPPRRVVIVGYDGDAMEPFVSCDGHYLLFNNLNQPPVNTDIFFATRQDAFTWRFRGKVEGINTPALEGCPTMDRTGRLYFVSPRDYARTLCTIYTGLFRRGRVTGVQLVESISRRQPGQVNFDAGVSPDGKTLVFVDSLFRPGAGPQTADLVLARWNGARFVRSPDSARLLQNVNTDALEYAPALSADGLTLYFTRFDPAPGGYAGPQIFRAVRPSVLAPFGIPTHLTGLGGFVEGPALSPDGRLLYFHRKDGDRFRLYAVSIR